jgi:hypothetical protein
MSTEQSVYDSDSTDALAQFYADCGELTIPPVQYIAELPALYVSANGSECQRCDDGTRARFVIEHECLELRVRAVCCPDHAAVLVREIGGSPDGSRIEDWQQVDTRQGALGAANDGGSEQEGQA